MCERASRAVHEPPGQIWVALDEARAAHAAALASGQRLRGADAVYAGVASQHGSTLVTRDREQLVGLPPIVPTVTPEEALARLRALEASGAES